MKSKLSIWILAGLLVTGIIGGAIANAATSTSSTPPATGQQVQSATQGNDKAEVKGVDKDNVQEGQGAQVEDGKPDSLEREKKGPDTDNIQHEDQGGQKDTGTATP